MNFSYKHKIFAVIGVFLILSAVLYVFGFSAIDSLNDKYTDQLVQKQEEYQNLEAEQQSYQAGKRDISSLVNKPYQPDSLFSSDTKVVKEIKTIEALSKDYDLDMRLSVSGTVSDATKAEKVAGELYTVPYSITISGSFPELVTFLESMEHLQFVTHIKGLTINALAGSKVTAILSGTFYIKK